MDYWALKSIRRREFVCSYCYARYTHATSSSARTTPASLTDAEFSDYPRARMVGVAFERGFFVKEHVVAHSTPISSASRSANASSSGTATIPYQPADAVARHAGGVARLTRCAGTVVRHQITE